CRGFMVGLGLCFVSLGTVISLSAMVSLAKASVIHRPSVPAIEQEGRPPLLHLRLCSTSNAHYVGSLLHLFGFTGWL
ncbi:hypothetical protein, partial [Yersinia pestis]|uniref:hypothetical protein n=1 Tax=Yersinia pestis TaxID=632 RepID=UPI001C552C6D